MCERVEEHLVATLEDESLSGFEEHLVDCPRCQNGLARLTLLNKELKEALTVPNWPLKSAQMQAQDLDGKT
jgi:hypothetical protein